MIPDIQTPFRIGPVEIRNRIALAPMSGVTDLPFRQLAWRYGAGLVVTEMVASRELVGNTQESWARLKNSGIDPHMVQLAGREPKWMAEGARIAEAHGAQIIDINMGCPAKKVTGGLSGSALMREPDLALAIIEATVKAVKVPVTVKMRLGWDENSINAPVLARRAEEAGVQLITIHGRTRMQFYEGRADWNAIRAVRDAISIPLIANGDVGDVSDINDILAQSGADAVMIGRSSQGRPWHAGVLAGHRDAPAAAEIGRIFSEHYHMMLDFYGEGVAVRHARKHVSHYLALHAGNFGAAERAEILMSRDAGFVIDRTVEAILAAEGQQARRSAA